jgi:hypothetical protein
MNQHQNLQFDLSVPEDQRIELQLPLPPGQRVRVIVFPAGVDDLMQAAESSTRFWDNALDDEDWNEA